MRFIGSDEDVSIPSEIDGKAVTVIGDGAFENCFDIKTVIIPDSVKTLGEYSFCYDVSLTSVKLGNGVKSIQKGCFHS